MPVSSSATQAGDCPNGFSSCFQAKNASLGSSAFQPSDRRHSSMMAGRSSGSAFRSRRSEGLSLGSVTIGGYRKRSHGLSGWEELPWRGLVWSVGEPIDHLGVGVQPWSPRLVEEMGLRSNRKLCPQIGVGQDGAERIRQRNRVSWRNEHPRFPIVAALPHTADIGGDDRRGRGHCLHEHQRHSFVQ